MPSVKALLSRGPGPMLEFMVELDANALAETLSAFANGVGGTIVFGMGADGAIQPDLSDYTEPTLARALRLCKPAFRPSDLPELHTEPVSGGTIATLIVRPTPYEITVADRGAFVRSGATNLRLSDAHKVAARRSFGLGTFEDESVPGATQDDFDDAILDEYQRNRIRRGPRGESLTRDELLLDVGAVDSMGVPTVSGLLLFGANPRRFLPQTGIVIVRLRGTNMRDASVAGERYSRRIEVDGPAARIIEKTWEVLFDEIHGESITNGLAREECYEYPLEAVREAVVNAVCHRDYAVTGRRIEIRLFDDHIEMISPGGLPGHITVENIVDEHYSRNPRLVRGLYYWGYIEELGQGVDIIMDAMRREHHPEPEFRDSGQSFTVVLRNTIDEIDLYYADQLNSRQLQVVRFLQNADRITNREYRELCPDVTAETLRLDLRDMVEKRILLKIGSKRGTYYVRK